MNSNFLQDNEGNSSSMRLANLLWLVGVLVAWLYVAFVTKTLPEIPQTVAAIIGLCLTAKVVQKHVEVNAEAKKDV